MKIVFLYNFTDTFASPYNMECSVFGQPPFYYHSYEKPIWMTHFGGF